MNRRSFIAALAAPLIAPTSWMREETFITSRRYSVIQIARIFQVPPELLFGYPIEWVSAPNREAEIFATAWFTPEDLL